MNRRMSRPAAFYDVWSLVPPEIVQATVCRADPVARTKARGMRDSGGLVRAGCVYECLTRPTMDRQIWRAAVGNPTTSYVLLAIGLCQYLIGGDRDNQHLSVNCSTTRTGR